MTMRPVPPPPGLAWLALASLASPALAGSSANYSLTHESVGTSGSRGTSASYSIVTAATPGQTGASAAYTHRGGYAGQLSESLSLFLSATPPSVNEGATRQIAAFLVQDESLLVPQNPASLTWTIVSGPIVSLSPSGLATAAPVYQSTPASIRATLGSLAATLDLQVLNTLPDNFAAYANDSLDDAWQVEFFGLNHPSASPSADPDFDGQDNRFEFDAGLSPVDPASRFLIAFAPVPHQPLSLGILFSPRLPDRTYTVYAAPTPDRAAASPITPGPIIDSGNQRLVADPNPDPHRKFYHIRISRP